MGGKVIEVNGLKTEFRMKCGTVFAVNGVSYYVNAGEIVGIVGESGCGKSVTQMSSVQLLAMPPAEIVEGEVLFGGRDLLAYDKDSEDIRKIRGSEVAMIFQEPMTSLNPVLTVGEQISESLRLHKGLDKNQAKERVVELLKMVGIPDPESRYGQYPHEFSGGMCQRIMIAMAISCDPKLLIADEATTALDVTTQAQILETLQDIVKKTGTALIIVTHNLGIVARYADRIYVMYAGRVVESGSTEQIFRNPSHAYTVGLLNSIPRLDDDRERALVPIDGLPPNLNKPVEHCPFLPRCTQALPECAQQGVPELREREPGHCTACINTQLDRSMKKSDTRLDRRRPSDETILEIKDLSMSFRVKSKKIGEKPSMLQVLDGVDLTLRRGETLGLVGESGCGKTTVAKCILRLLNPSGGSIMFEGMDLAVMKESQLRTIRKKIQFIFQDPFGSLDPHQTIGDIVGEPLIVHKLTSSKEAYNNRVRELFGMVGLDYAMHSRAPHELSGGQRQRIGIARALASEPELIICDEPVSALDVSVQAQILNLLEKLQQEMNLSYIFIAHDLSVVRHISDRIAVMYLGRVVETATCEQLYENPVHPYTRALLSAIPIPDPQVEKTRKRQPLLGEMPSIAKRPSGCSFHPRCAYADAGCAEKVPALEGVDLYVAKLKNIAVIEIIVDFPLQYACAVAGVLLREFIINL